MKPLTPGGSLDPTQLSTSLETRALVAPELSIATVDTRALNAAEPLSFDDFAKQLKLDDKQIASLREGKQSIAAFFERLGNKDGGRRAQEQLIRFLDVCMNHPQEIPETPLDISAVWIKTFNGTVYRPNVSLKRLLDILQISLVDSQCLQGANLSGGNFIFGAEGVDFTRANLSRSIVNGTDFCYGNFTDANLSGMTNPLGQGTYTQADLFKATPEEEVRLRHANCTRTDFSNVKLYRPSLYYTKFDNPNLAGAEFNNVVTVKGGENFFDGVQLHFNDGKKPEDLQLIKDWFMNKQCKEFSYLGYS